MLGQMLLTGVAVALSVFVLKVHQRSQTKNPPRWLRVLIHDILGRLVCDNIRSRDRCIRRDNQIKVADMVRKQITVRDLLKENSNIASSDETNATSDDTDTSVDKKPEVELLERIAARMQIITQHLNTVQSDPYGCDEWKDIARVLDKIFFWLSIVFNVIISVFSLFVLPALAPQYIKPVQAESHRTLMNNIN